MEEKRQSKRQIVPFRILIVLFCLALISTYYCSSLYAKFSTGVPSSALAEAARFSVKAEGNSEVNPKTIEIKAYSDENNDVTYSILLKNPGDVAVKYETVIYVNNEALLDEEGKPVSFTGELAAGGSCEIEIPLYVMNPDALDFNNETGYADVPFVALVTFTQID